MQSAISDSFHMQNKELEVTMQKMLRHLLTHLTIFFVVWLRECTVEPRS